jgi:hypothetical protein
LGVIVLVLAACGNAGADDAEVDIDEDSGNVSIETDEGSVNLGSDLEIPDGLSIEVPPGGSVTTVLELDNEFVVAVFYDIGEFDNLVDFYTEWTAEQSVEFDKSTNEFVSADGVPFKSVIWYGNDLDTSINIVNCFVLDPSGDETEQVCLSLSDSR